MGSQVQADAIFLFSNYITESTQQKIWNIGQFGTIQKMYRTCNNIRILQNRGEEERMGESNFA